MENDTTTSLAPQTEQPLSSTSNPLLDPAASSSTVDLTASDKKESSPSLKSDGWDKIGDLDVELQRDKADASNQELDPEVDLMPDDFSNNWSSMSSRFDNGRSQDISQKLGEKMLQGWTMLNKHCPSESCACPLVRDLEGKMLCVSCGSTVLEDASPALRQSGTEPSPSPASAPRSHAAGESSSSSLQQHMSKVDDISKKIGGLLMQGWTLTDLRCPDCEAVCIKDLKGLLHCCDCQFVQEDDKSGADEPELVPKYAKNNLAEPPAVEFLDKEAAVAAILAGATQEPTLLKRARKPKASEDSNSSSIAAKMAAKLQAGWTLMSEACPMCGVPVLRNKKQNQMWCVACNLPVMAEKEFNPNVHGHAVNGDSPVSDHDEKRPRKDSKTQYQSLAVSSPSQPSTPVATFPQADLDLVTQLGAQLGTIHLSTDSYVPPMPNLKRAHTLTVVNQTTTKKTKTVEDKGKTSPMSSKPMVRVRRRTPAVSMSLPDSSHDGNAFSGSAPVYFVPASEGGIPPVFVVPASQPQPQSQSSSHSEAAVVKSTQDTMLQKLEYAQKRLLASSDISECIKLSEFIAGLAAGLHALKNI